MKNKLSTIILTAAILLSCFSCQKKSETVQAPAEPVVAPQPVETQRLTLYFVRHAEKADQSKNPSLTRPGRERANRLVDVLAKANIQRVYSTDYKRTKETAAPLAEKNNIKVKIYDPRDVAGLIAELNQPHLGNALIVGHSNSTPTLVNSIIGHETYKQIDESNYDNLYIVKIKESEISSLLREYF